MLGKLGMTVDDCIIAYTDLSKQVFAKKKPMWRGPQFSSVILEEKIIKMIEDVLKERETVPPNPLPPAEEIAMNTELGGKGCKA